MCQLINSHFGGYDRFSDTSIPIYVLAAISHPSIEPSSWHRGCGSQLLGRCCPCPNNPGHDHGSCMKWTYHMGLLPDTWELEIYLHHMTKLLSKIRWAKKNVAAEYSYRSFTPRSNQHQLDNQKKLWSVLSVQWTLLLTQSRWYPWLACFGGDKSQEN